MPNDPGAWPQAPRPITTLSAADTPAIVQLVGSLDGPELWHRFNRAVTPTQVRDHYAALDWTGTAILGWQAGDGLCALAEVALHAGPAGPQAEIVVTVRRGWRGRGIGEELLDAAIGDATRRGAVRCLMVVGPGDPGLPLARSRGAHVDLATGLATLTG